MEPKPVIATSLLALFILAVPALQKTEEEEAPAPKEASLTIRLHGPAWTKSLHSTAFVAVQTDGGPPTTTTTLSDSSGLSSATVKRVGEHKCSEVDLRRAGNGNDEWCLRIDGLDSGAEFKGVVPGADTNLTLTVTERYHFFFMPLGWLICGLFLGWIWVMLTTRILPEWIPQKRLKTSLKKNQNAIDGPKIEGLDTWASNLRKRKTAKSVYKAVQEIRRDAETKANEARSVLATALSQSSLPDTSPLKADARTEADSTAYRVEHFYGTDGKPKELHPAAEWTKTINTMEAIGLRLKAALNAIEGRVPSADRPPLRSKHAYVQEKLHTLQDPSGIAEIEEEVDALEQLVLLGIQNQLTPEELLIIGGGPMYAIAPDQVIAVVVDEAELIIAKPPVPPRLSLKEDPRATEVVTFGVLLFTILIQAAIGIYTVATAVYSPNHTFGTEFDQASMVAAAFASSAAAGVVTLWAIWSPAQSDE